MKKYILATSMVALIGATLIAFNGEGIFKGSPEETETKAFNDGLKNSDSKTANLDLIKVSNKKDFTKVNVVDSHTIEVTDNVSLEFGENFRLSEKSRVQMEMVNAKELKVTYNVKNNLKEIGQLVITTREIDNGDVVVYQEMKYSIKKPTTFSTKIKVKNAKNYSMFEIAEKDVKREHNKTFGIDMTTNVRGLLTFETEDEKQVADVYLSQNYISKSLEKEYEDSTKSVLRELKEENTEFKIVEDDSGYYIESNMKLLPEADNSDLWFVVSNDKLIKKDSVKESYKNKTNHSFIQNVKWQVSDGNYTKLPWSIEPFKEMGYGRNLVALQDDNSLNYYQDTKDNLFYDLTVVSTNNLLLFKGNDNLWETEYTSTWLKKSYGIQAPYVDTRHNENIALFLGEVGETLDIDKLKKSPLNYADFLAEQKANGNVIETKNGYFVADYFSENANAKTHTSLNHALGEANFLIGLYFNESADTAKEEYLETALNIYQAIQDNSKSWIRENGDFWYQINSDGTYTGTDYDTLTLEDITYAMLLLNKNGLLQDYPALPKMMLSKLHFVMGQGYDIPQLTVKNLKDLGYEEEVKNYKNVLKF